jgi:hypothetical protein
VRTGSHGKGEGTWRLQRGRSVCNLRTMLVTHMAAGRVSASDPGGASAREAGET